MRKRTCLLALPLAYLSFVTNTSATPLEPEEIDKTRYGYRFGLVNTNRSTATIRFRSPGGDAVLHYTAYDIDFPDEVGISVNGKRVGFVSQTPNAGFANDTITLPAKHLKVGENTLSFEQKSRNFRWGVTNLKLSFITDEVSPSLRATVPLEIDITNHDRYGFRFLGYDNNREGAAFTFVGQSHDVQLYYKAYDIDVKGEVRIVLNGEVVRELSTTPNEGTEDDFVILPAAQQVRGTNTVEFRQQNPGYRWGVTDVLLVEAGWCLEP